MAVADIAQDTESDESYEARMKILADRPWIRCWGCGILTQDRHLDGRSMCTFCAISGRHG